MKVSARLHGRVTSVSIHDSLCVLHYLLTNTKANKPIQDHMNDFVAREVLPTWESHSAKGLSTCVTHMLVKDCLDKEDHSIFETLLEEVSHAGAR